MSNVTNAHKETISARGVETQNRAYGSMQQEDARLHIVWDKAMKDMERRRAYRNVAVLLISWDANQDHLSMAEEVCIPLKGNQYASS